MAAATPPMDQKNEFHFEKTEEMCHEYRGMWIPNTLKS